MTDRGAFPIDDFCPECELTHGRHETWCSAHYAGDAGMPTEDGCGAAVPVRTDESPADTE